MPDIVLLFIVLSILILGHEFGHFITAKLLGVHVEEFGIGFPPRLKTLFQAGGTNFSINWLPFGGFVRLSGEDDPQVKGGFASSRKSVRAAILIAGPAANILLAIFAFTAAFKFAAPDIESVLITEVQADTPAETAGLLVGDIIREVDNVPIVGIESLQLAVKDNIGVPTNIVIEREGEDLHYSITPRTTFPDGQGPIGITIGNPTKQVGWLEAAGAGVNATRLQITALFHLPGQLIRGEIEPEAARVSGFKGMYDMLVWAGQIDRSSQRPFLTLSLIGVISTGLALANLLPIPALDGGRLTFIGLEAILGRRLPPQYEGLAHTIGFMVLLALLIYFNLQDFINPISLPR